jgi:hypothetical protein
VEEGRETLSVWLLSAFLVVLLSLLTAHVGIGLSDEGYLWYGAIATAHGEVPLRDFQSYDPGRYYWAALFFKLLSREGLVALRLSCFAFDFVALGLGLLAVRRVVRGWEILPWGALLLLWMWPRFRAFDTGLPLSAVFFATRLVEKPSAGRHLASGVFVGVAAFFGRNHGLFSSIGFSLLILFIAWRIEREHLARKILLFGLGIALGYAPMLLLVAGCPGLFESLLKSGSLWAERGSQATLPLPIPWPWSHTSPNLPVLERLARFAIGAFYVLLPLFYLVVAAALLKTRDLSRSALLIGSLFLGASYLPVPFSRAGVLHLASGIHPLLTGLLAAPAFFPTGPKRAPRLALWAFLSLSSALSVGYWGYLFPLQVALGRGGLPERVGSDVLYVRPEDGRTVSSVEELAAGFKARGESVLFVPYSPGLYPVLGLHSPLHTLVFLWPEKEGEQRAMIESLDYGRVGAVFLWDSPWDGREELRFRNTHPLVFDHLQRNFEREKVEALGRDFTLYRRRAGPLSGG